MAMVRDPAFWKRFSTAVHLDEEAQNQLKHSYVEPLSPALASQSSIPRPSTKHTTAPLFSSSSSQPSTAPQHPVPASATTPAPAPTSSITPTTSTSRSKPKNPPPPTRKITKTKTTTTTTEFAPASKPPLYTRRNASQRTLGLSGRPPSRFKFWTSISADPHNRESWLEEQQRKKSKRTCMCWGFWLVFFAFVAGLVVTILLLKSKGII